MDYIYDHDIKLTENNDIEIFNGDVALIADSEYIRQLIMVVSLIGLMLGIGDQQVQ